MLYAFDSSRNCVVFAYPNICKRTKVFSAWQKTAKTIAYSCAEELAMHAGDAAMVGHEITNEKSGDSVRYSAPKAIHQFRIQVAEIYKKI